MGKNCEIEIRDKTAGTGTRGQESEVEKNCDIGIRDRASGTGNRRQELEAEPPGQELGITKS